MDSQKLPAGSPASSPAPGLALLEAQGTPRRSTAAPPLSRCHGLSLAYCRPRLHIWEPTPEGQTQPAKARATTHLDYLSPPWGPLYLLVSSMGHRWATKPSQVMWEQTTPRSKDSPQEHKAWGNRPLRVRLREKLSRWWWGWLHQGPRGCKF